MLEDIVNDDEHERLPGFPERLRHARETAKLTQRDLADAILVSPQAIWNYENRQGGISAAKLFPLADRLGVSARWLALGHEGGTLPDDPKLSAVVESAACLEAYLESNGKPIDLVKAALTILRGAMN